MKTANRESMVRFKRINRAVRRERRGEALAADSSSGSSVFGSLQWDSDLLEQAFPSEGDDDVLAYKCAYVEGPRFFKYLSYNRQKRWHNAALECFNRYKTANF
mmetsp:Transcript_78797/g.127779  ORF Transcript_78797/g.127779 Transcript_78797/m.127779 type:complete len:103 (-) Transcript_78797:48-356(-)